MVDEFAKAIRAKMPDEDNTDGFSHDAHTSHCNLFGDRLLGASAKLAAAYPLCSKAEICLFFEIPTIECVAFNAPHRSKRSVCSKQPRPDRLMRLSSGRRLTRFCTVQRRGVRRVLTERAPPCGRISPRRRTLPMAGMEIAKVISRLLMKVMKGRQSATPDVPRDDFDSGTTSMFKASRAQTQRG